MTLGDIIVISALVMIVALIIRGMIRDKKQGKCSGCSGCSDCSSCSGCAACQHACNGCPGAK
ncbi:MAG: FeoB-associated Cys-rich membrane protein [Oscillospiraceae bacterium]|nr:FeoB-associated Cys-rich membrane protein [Oscillospiraceae bacterium]